MSTRFLSILISILFFTAPLTAVADDAAFAKQMEAYLANEGNLDKLGNALQAHFQSKRNRDQASKAKQEEQEREEQFKNPIKIDIAGSPTKGKADAKITVVEFSDFQCPFCSRAADTVYEVLKAYPNDVKVAFKHLPLGFHQQAKPAARASMAANEQGKFWEMHDKLFERQKELNDDLYPQLAKELGLDVDKFKADFASGKYDKQIDADMAIAQQHGIRGTPGFFINGVKLSGARPFPHFKEIIDRWLAEAK